MQINLETDTSQFSSPRCTAAEFFAGAGLVRMGLEQTNIDLGFATVFNSTQLKSYAANLGAEEFFLTDIRNISGANVQDVQIATNSIFSMRRFVADGKTSRFERRAFRLVLGVCAYD